MDLSEHPDIPPHTNFESVCGSVPAEFSRSMPGTLEAADPLKAPLAAYTGNLELFEADLTTPGSYDAAVKGANYIFHVASPAEFTVSRKQCPERCFQADPLVRDHTKFA